MKAAIRIAIMIGALVAIWYAFGPSREANRKADEAAQARYEAAKEACFKSAPDADSYEDCIQKYVDDHTPDQEYDQNP
jgi:hypothetical protein